MFFKRYSFLFFCFLVLPLSARAQTSDTVRAGVHQLQAVSVTAQKQTYFSPGSRVATLDSIGINTQNSGSLSDLLQSRTPLFIKNYGQGMLSSISFRGTSARHTALLWNGLNINFPTLGEADFSLIPVNANSQVTIQHGSASSSYGSGAIGGAILLENPVSWQKDWRLQAQQDIGSFGRYYSSLSGQFGNGRLFLNTTIFRQQNRNDFEFVNTARFGSPTEKLQNAQSEQKGFTQDIGYKLTGNSHLAFKSWFNLMDRQIQASMVSASNNAREKDRNIRLMGEYNLHTALGNTVLKTAFFEDVINYANDNIAADSKVKTYQAVAEQQVWLTGKINLKTGADVQHFDADADGYNRTVTENRASVFALLRYNPTQKASLSLNLRQSFVQRFDPPVAPALGLQYMLLQDSLFTLTLKSNIARSYRVPTLNERFWPTGNPGIKPETGMSYEAGLAGDLHTGSGPITTEITVYRMLVSDWIQWVPGRSGQDWTPRNLSQVAASGLEASAKYQHKGPVVKYTLGAGYTFTRSVQKQAFNPTELQKQLLYVPLHSASVFADAHAGNWLLTANANYTGHRYTTNTNNTRLPGYLLLNASGGYTFGPKPCRLQLLATIYNLTNAVYHPIAWQAMPPRHYGISLRFLMNNYDFNN